MWMWDAAAGRSVRLTDARPIRITDGGSYPARVPLRVAEALLETPNPRPAGRKKQEVMSFLQELGQDRCAKRSTATFASRGVEGS